MADVFAKANIGNHLQVACLMKASKFSFFIEYLRKPYFQLVSVGVLHSGELGKVWRKRKEI